MKKKIIYSLVFLAIILTFGTIFYHNVENWAWIDSFYFTSMTILTIGYGDFVPTRDISKIFTVFYSFFTIGFLLVLFADLKKEKMYFTQMLKDTSRDIKRFVTKEVDIAVTKKEAEIIAEKTAEKTFEKKKPALEKKLTPKNNQKRRAKRSK